MGLLQKVKTEFLLCERGKEETPFNFLQTACRDIKMVTMSSSDSGISPVMRDKSLWKLVCPGCQRGPKKKSWMKISHYIDAVEFLGQIKEIVSKHRNNKILLAKPKSYELRIGGLEDTVHAGDGEQLEVWKDCYLPERMEMVVIGALDDFRCSAAGWQLVLLLCEDGNVYAYEFEVLHLVARSLEDLFETGAEFPGLEKFRFGECFEELSEEEMKKEMQCDEIKKIDDEHIHFRRRLQIEMLEDLKAISQSEVIMIQTEGMRDITKHDKSVYIEIRESLRLK